MSRRLRTEDKKLQQTKNEEDDEEDKLKLQKEKIYAPLVWRRLGYGIKIQDLKELHYEEILKLIQTYYINEEVLCKNSEIADDEVSLKTFLDRALFNMKDNTSLVAVKEDTNEIAGATILKVVHKIDFGRTFSKTILQSGDAAKKCMDIKTTLMRKVDVFEFFKCDSFLRIYIVVIKPEFRKKGLGFQMLKTSMDVARHLKLPVIIGIFANCTLQNKAKKIGMNVLHEIKYVEWRDKNGEMIFDDPGAGNYTCALMGCFVPAAPEPEPPPPPKQEEEVKKEKVTRADKRTAKAKAKKKMN